MKNMKLAVKLAIGFGSLVAVALLFGGAAVWEMAAVGREFRKKRVVVTRRA